MFMVLKIQIKFPLRIRDRTGIKATNETSHAFRFNNLQKRFRIYEETFLSKPQCDTLGFSPEAQPRKSGFESKVLDFDCVRKVSQI